MARCQAALARLEAEAAAAADEEEKARLEAEAKAMAERARHVTRAQPGGCALLLACCVLLACLLAARCDASQHLADVTAVGYRPVWRRRRW